MSEAEQQIHSWQQCRNKREELDLLSNKWDNENCHHKNDIDQDHLTDKGPERLSCCTSINLQRLFPSCQVGIKELQKAIHSGKSSLSQGYSEFGSSQRRLNELSLIQRLLSECVANHHANSQVHPFLRCPYRYEEGFIWWLIRYWQGSTKNWPTGQKSGATVTSWLEWEPPPCRTWSQRVSHHQAVWEDGIHPYPGWRRRRGVSKGRDLIKGCWATR